MGNYEASLRWEAEALESLGLRFMRQTLIDTIGPVGEEQDRISDREV